MGRYSAARGYCPRELQAYGPASRRSQSSGRGLAASPHGSWRSLVLALELSTELCTADAARRPVPSGNTARQPTASMTACGHLVRGPGAHGDRVRLARAARYGIAASERLWESEIPKRETNVTHRDQHGRSQCPTGRVTAGGDRSACSGSFQRGPARAIPTRAPFGPGRRTMRLSRSTRRASGLPTNDAFPAPPSRRISATGNLEPRV